MAGKRDSRCAGGSDGDESVFDLTEVFSRQFTPVDGGYLYYPSRKGGGKLVTADEFQQLLADWERRTRPGKVAGFAFLAILVWTILSQILSLPQWADDIMILGAVAAVSGWSFWAAYAPRRLVKARPVVASPRGLSEARREARSMLKWPFVLLILLVSGAIFIGTLSSPEPTLKWWAWAIGSGLMFLAYGWISFQKARDQRR